MGSKELSWCVLLSHKLQWLTEQTVPLGGEIIEVVSPFKPNTTAGRLLEKRGDGGYMIIMQTEDAKKRRENIEANGLAKVIYDYDHGDTVCVQYHPKGIKGALSPHCYAMVLDMGG